ncbi:hypothetical protein BJY01DRAFT_214307 [Aspergillus pseudoustus]|uniref:Uncharacterized protein n=1 Tax=Aspergillus pseudoustus TaxID=1810923 RepID=A0ABR4JZF8_9EURO
MGIHRVRWASTSGDCCGLSSGPCGWPECLQFTPEWHSVLISWVASSCKLLLLLVRPRRFR